MSYVQRNAVIANGGNASAGLDMQSGRLVGIIMPAAWTAADLTFQGSYDNITFYDVYNDSGDEYVIPASTSRMIVLSVPLAFPFVRVRSGTTGSPVTQLAERTIGIISA